MMESSVNSDIHLVCQLSGACCVWEFHDSRSMGSDHLPRAFMGPDDANKIHRCKVRAQDDGSLHMPADYKRLGKWLVINGKSTGNLT